MARLILDKDGYGSRGQLSLMADFFELCCSASKRQITHKVIVDYLFDRSIRVPMFTMFLLAEADDDDDDDDEDAEDEGAGMDHVTAIDKKRQRANEDATRILALILERERYLGAAYPFHFVDSVLSRRAPAVVAYDVALTLALRHGCLKDRSAANEFEGFVARCLAGRHWNVFALGERVRGAAGAGVRRFRPVFSQLAAQLHATPYPDAVVPERVHDRGADVVARWEPADDRPGCRTMLVQVTVGKAETWAGKASEPPRGAWKRLLGDPLEPHVALAVPHHVEREQLRELVENGNGATVLDRLRLVAHAPKVSASDRSSVLGVRTEGVEW